jgi:tripartite-type tricarboxylate transporter receptor subunit TctC
MNSTFSKCLAGLALIVVFDLASAAWPDKVVRIIAPYGPGGGVDIFTRPLATRLSETFGQTFVVDNRPGAGGTVGVRAAFEAPADGYTFLSGGVHQPMSEGLYPKRGYDIDKDFVPVALTARVPSVLVVTNNAPFNSVKELIAYARANPGKINYCSSGNGTAQHIVGESFKRLTGTYMTHIPYRGTAPAMTDLIGGQCQLMFDGLGTSASQIRGGRIRLIAVAAAKRTPLFPDAPTMKEAGGPEMDATIWYGWWARQGTPTEVLSRLRQAVRAALKDPSVVEAWKQQGAEVPDATDDETGPYVHAEAVRWKKAVGDLGITLD